MDGVPVGVVAAVVDAGESAFPITCVGEGASEGLLCVAWLEPEDPREGWSVANGME